MSHTRFEGTPVKHICNVQFITIKNEEGEVSFKVERLEDNKFTITDLATGKSTTEVIENFDVEHGALARFSMRGKERLVQLIETRHGTQFSFY